LAAGAWSGAGAVSVLAVLVSGWCRAAFGVFRDRFHPGPGEAVVRGLGGPPPGTELKTDSGYGFGHGEGAAAVR
jgi:hypothetical protein